MRSKVPSEMWWSSSRGSNNEAIVSLLIPKSSHFASVDSLLNQVLSDSQFLAKSLVLSSSICYVLENESIFCDIEIVPNLFLT
jgi:hypothetical protein